MKKRESNKALREFFQCSLEMSNRRDEIPVQGKVVDQRQKGFPHANDANFSYSYSYS